MSETSLFTKYKKNENRITNYTLLLLKQMYIESPIIFQELIVNLLSEETVDINVGVNFSQQKVYAYKKEKKSIIDGVIHQEPFNIFIETKIYDWFQREQLETEIENLLQQQGKKVYIALANYEGFSDARELFIEIKNKYKENKDLTIVNIEFEKLQLVLEEVSKNIKSESIISMINEYKYFLDECNLLPTWKYRLDVVNCASSKDEVIKNNLYFCPPAIGAYKHQRAKYFGIYENKKVDVIAEIKAVCSINNKKPEITWYNNNYNETEILNEIKSKKELFWETSHQVFLLGDFKYNLNFQKDSYGGMQCSKKYFTFSNDIQNIDDLEKAIKDKKWSEF